MLPASEKVFRSMPRKRLRRAPTSKHFQWECPTTSKSPSRKGRRLSVSDKRFLAPGIPLISTMAGLGLAAPHLVLPNDQPDVSYGVMEDDADGVSMPGPDFADAVTQVHAICPARASHGPVMNGEDHRISLRQRNHRGA